MVILNTLFNMYNNKLHLLRRELKKNEYQIQLKNMWNNTCDI